MQFILERIIKEGYIFMKNAPQEVLKKSGLKRDGVDH